ncbi:hypothetical protein EML15_03445 [Corynebacterium sp. sy017]|uniref:pyroglutamyl-peptidase I family protein n=1 Tax=unclassified Corynebacterium TaxID=2624378 RepID=UPI001186BC09|nr:MULTISPECIES: hypothetical protein [unclassified Corynebacterium]MBP3088204.1 hypothetical protein [Corynebacterium sp. sy017]TSD92706.1 hypothetical protein ELY17_03445 [Corynebacterium sp. SY003]
MSLILVTGFEPFAGNPRNTSWEMLAELPEEILGHRILRAQLPVTYDGGLVELERLIGEHSPIAICSFGLSGKTPDIRVETVARNWGGAKPDNNGVSWNKPYRQGAEYPEKVYPQISPQQVQEWLSESEIPVAASDDAGSYICEGVTYCAAYSGVPSTFIHVPAHSEDTAFSAEYHKVPLATLREAALRVVSGIAREY